MMLKRWTLSLLLAFFLSTGFVYAADLIDINTATTTELQTVKGIGQSTADAIIKYRKENGLFLSVEDLVKVKGIGDKKLSKLSASLVVAKPE